jgi:HK97 family phage prohead protease
VLHKAIADAQIKSEGPELGPGEFIAYASIFGNVDSYGDVVQPGAFTKTLQDWAAKGDVIPLVWAHSTDPDYYLGHILEASEDDRGLRVKGRIDLETPKGKSVHRMVTDRSVNQLSFAYTVRDSEQRADHVALKALDLHEVTLCFRGANDQTEVVAVKVKQDNNIQPKGDKMKIKTQREEVATKARVIVDGAKAEGVELTTEQASEVAGLLDQVKTFDEQIAERQKSADLIAAVEALGGTSVAPAESGAKSRKPPRR